MEDNVMIFLISGRARNGKGTVSKILKENYLECLGNKINLNIGIRYSENDDKTLIYIATPIIKLDY